MMFGVPGVLVQGSLGLQSSCCYRQTGWDKAAISAYISKAFGCYPARLAPSFLRKVPSEVGSGTPLLVDSFSQVNVVPSFLRT